MRSLSFKLTVAFLVVGLMGSIIVALLVQLQTRRDFDRFVLDMYQSELVTDLIAYYETHGSWDGVQNAITVIMRPGPDRNETFTARAPILVVDDARRVVLGAPELMGQQITFDTRQGLRLEVDGQVVGWIVLNGRDVPWESGSPEGAFLNRINQNILVSAGIAIVLALAIGFLLARTISQPVRELRTATQLVAGGRLGYQVPVRTRDELGQLAASFNQMSADLARSNALRRQMTADVAHELRNPLSVMLGYTEALSESKLGGSPRVFQIMHDEALHLQRLIEDLRTLSLADAGELTLVRQPTSPGALLERVAVAHAPRAQEKDISIEVKTDQELPDIPVDPDRMAQVLSNLVTNALRHTPQGGRIQLAAEQTSGGIVIRVVDSGTGIPAEELPYIFERFYRGDPSRYRRAGESGLGLAIVKSLVEAHSGSVSVESLPGQGSTFTITIPL